MSISFNGRITRHDLRRAMVLDLLPNRWPRNLAAAGLILLAVALAPVLLGGDAWRATVFPLYIGLVLLFPWWFPCLSDGALWRRNEAYRAPMSGEADGNGVHLVTARSDVRIGVG